MNRAGDGNKKNRAGKPAKELYSLVVRYVKYTVKNFSTRWNDLDMTGKIYRGFFIASIAYVAAVFLFAISDQINEKTDDTLPKTHAAQKREDVLKATVFRLRNEPGGGLYWVNSINMKRSDGSRVSIKVNRPSMRERDIILSTNNDNFDMIGAEYHTGSDTFYNSDTGTNMKLTLDKLDYPGKRAEFEFTAMLLTNLRDKGKSAKVRFAVEGEHFDTAVKAGIIALGSCD